MLGEEGVHRGEVLVVIVRGHGFVPRLAGLFEDVALGVPDRVELDDEAALAVAGLVVEPLLPLPGGLGLRFVL